MRSAGMSTAWIDAYRVGTDYDEGRAVASVRQNEVGWALNDSGPMIRRLVMEGLRLGDDMLERDRSTPTRERETAFAAFAERRLLEHYRLAAVILGDPGEAEDATHDAFELAWRHWGSLRDPERLDAWFGRILINVCRDRLRRRKRHAVTDLSPEVVASIAAGDDAAFSADRDELGHAFACLNPDQRVAIVLRYYADLSVPQIAERVSAPVGTVKSRLHHALQVMNSALVVGRDERSAR